jgi:two-component system nitrate/nitrite response regulator NarL
MKLMIVDDHALFRHGLSLTLKELFEDASVREAATIDEALRLAREAEGAFDLALVDLVMPGMDAFEGIRKLREQLGRTPVVVISSSEDPSDVRAALDQGAQGYVLKSSAAQVLGHALPLVLAGEIFVPAVALASPGPANAPAPGTSPPTPAQPMTVRQVQVLELLSRGESNKEIARNLGMVESTVKVHVRVILQKLGVKNRTQAAIAGIQQGYIKNAPDG